MSRAWARGKERRSSDIAVRRESGQLGRDAPVVTAAATRPPTTGQSGMRTKERTPAPLDVFRLTEEPGSSALLRKVHMLSAVAQHHHGETVLLTQLFHALCPGQLARILVGDRLSEQLRDRHMRDSTLTQLTEVRAVERKHGKPDRRDDSHLLDRDPTEAATPRTEAVPTPERGLVVHEPPTRFPSLSQIRRERSALRPIVAGVPSASTVSSSPIVTGTISFGR